jgi:hypothetical protein
MKICVFRTVPLSIIRSYSLYTQQWYISHSFADSLLSAKPPSFQSEGQILVDISQQLSQSNGIFSPYWNAVSAVCKISRWEEVHWLDWDKINWYKARFEGLAAVLMEIPALYILTLCRLVYYFDVVVGLVWSHDPKSYAGGSVCYW